MKDEQQLFNETFYKQRKKVSLQRKLRRQTYLAQIKFGIKSHL